jgi:CDGSH-type Zn-finger protein/uncharacterized Fe-S cluster protein YjdI
MAKHSYQGQALRVLFEPRRCIHARQCVLGLPQVFRAEERAWIAPDAAGAEAVIAQVAACPSGALTYERLDGGTVEQAPAINRIRLWEHGPYELRADMEIAGERRLRAVLCRCGASKNKPFCDNSHRDIAFKATGEPKEACETERLAARGGRLEIRPTRDGPFHVLGNVEIVCGSGRRVACHTETWLCRCGASASKPYCDGSHERIGFTADGVDE